MLKQGLNNMLYELVGEYTSKKEEIDNDHEIIRYKVESILPSEEAVDELFKVAAQVRNAK